jgi:hypothetical protein
MIASASAAVGVLSKMTVPRSRGGVSVRIDRGSNPWRRI